MTLPVPTAATLAQRFISALAQQSFIATDGSTVTLDATAPMTPENAIAIVNAMGQVEIYLFARDIGLELMVTTATEAGLLSQHATIWRVPRRSATAAVGNFVVTNIAVTAVTLPIGTLITVDGSVQWSVTSAVTIQPGASASVPVEATTAGATGNLAANAPASLVSPVAGVSSVIADQSGIAGGADIEAVETWRARILAAIRNPIGGGKKSDYEEWATTAGASYVQVVPGVDGLGTVAVYVLMSGPAVPTATQVADIQSYIDGVRPVRGNVTVYAGSVTVQNPTITLKPDTVSARAAVVSQLAPVYLAAGMGGTVTVEALQAAIAAAAGTNNTLVSPTSDLDLAYGQMAELGTPTWGASS